MYKLLIFISIIGLAYAEKECQEGWFEVEGDCYHIGEELLNYFESLDYCRNLTSSLVEFEKEQIPKLLKVELLKERLDNCGIEPCAWWVADKYKYKCVELSHYVTHGIFNFKFRKFESYTSWGEDTCKTKLKPICHKKLL